MNKLVFSAASFVSTAALAVAVYPIVLCLWAVYALLRLRQALANWSRFRF